MVLIYYQNAICLFHFITSLFQLKHLKNNMNASIYYYSHYQMHGTAIKRQWQGSNLRIHRIIDFKSIALDHSATLSDRKADYSFN